MTSTATRGFVTMGSYARVFSRNQRGRDNYEWVVIVEQLVHEANLAWAVAEATKPYLSAIERDAVFVAIGAGETFAAIRELLRSVATKRIPLGPDLLQQCRTWLHAYGEHEDEGDPRRLIEEPLIPYMIRVPATMWATSVGSADPTGVFAATPTEHLQYVV